METLTDTDTIWFGKHNRTPLEDVPASYLIWLWNQGLKQEVGQNSKRGALARYIRDNRGALEGEAPDSIMD